MFTRVTNLLFACGAMFLSATGWVIELDGSPQPKTSSSFFPVILMSALATCWLVSGLGLFYKSRLAWVFSFIAAGASALFMGTALAVAIWIFVYPDDEIHRLWEIGAAGMIFCLVQFLALFASSLGLTVGIFKMRQITFSKRRS
jgi:hypothetical protein